MQTFKSNITALRGYQVAGYKFLVRGRGLLAFDVGLGKTATAVAGCVVGGYKQVLIVCPLGLKDQWVREIKQIETLYEAGASFTEDVPQPKLLRLEASSKGIKRTYVLAHPEQLIAGGKMPSKILPSLLRFSWDVVIVDEVHRFSNHHTHQWAGLNQLKTARKWGLTGTPVRDTLNNLYGILKWLEPKRFPSYVAFINTYCEVEQGQYGEKVTGIKQVKVDNRTWSTQPTLAMLRRETEDLILTKKLEDVGLQLPEKLPVNDVVLTMDDDQADLYRKVQTRQVVELMREAEEDGLNVWDLLGSDPENHPLIILNAAARFAYLQRVTSDPQHFGQGACSNVKMDWLKDYIQSGGAPAVIFTRFVDTAKRIQKYLQTVPGGSEFIVGTYDSLSEGKNFQHLHVQIRWDLPLKRQFDEQATGRVHRMGQTQQVQTFRLLCKDSLDLYLRAILENKQDTVDAVIMWLRGLRDAERKL